MIELTAKQGSAEWMAARSKCFCASEAPAMMGVSPYMTRTELLKQKATGITPDIDLMTQKRFDAGHIAEAMARPIIETMIGEDLYPVVATTDDGKMLASSDGATMLYDTGFEHKLFNAALAESIKNGIVPDSHAWQLDHQIAVFGFERIIFVCSDGTEENMHLCEYRTTPERQAKLMAGWVQFEQDLAAYKPEVPTMEAPAGRAPDMLPALRIEVTGMVTASNLEAFRNHALTVFGNIKTDLQTDADFADAEKTVKWCKEVEDRLDAAKQHALSQTASIDELFSTIDAIKEEARQKRLHLDKLVKTEKEARKTQIVTGAMQAYQDHLNSLSLRTDNCMPMRLPVNFGEAVKGLKSLDSMRDKVSSALANAKVEANQVADLIEANRKTVEDMSLFPDFATVCTKAPDDFAALMAMRIQRRAEAEEKRLEAERAKIRAEEQAKAQREAEQKAQMAEHERLVAERAAQREADAKAAADRAAEASRIVPSAMHRIDDASAAGSVTPDLAGELRKTVAYMASEIAIEHASTKAAETGAMITLGQVNALLAPVTLTSAGIASLGIVGTKERAAVLYRTSDVPKICTALIRRLTAVASGERSAA